jgi:hypothetical protein
MKLFKSKKPVPKPRLSSKASSKVSSKTPSLSPRSSLSERVLRSAPLDTLPLPPPPSRTIEYDPRAQLPNTIDSDLEWVAGMSGWGHPDLYPENLPGNFIIRALNEVNGINWGANPNFVNSLGESSGGNLLGNHGGYQVRFPQSPEKIGRVGFDDPSYYMFPPKELRGRTVYTEDMPWDLPGKITSLAPLQFIDLLRKYTGFDPSSKAEPGKSNYDPELDYWPHSRLRKSLSPTSDADIEN